MKISTLALISAGMLLALFVNSCSSGLNDEDIASCKSYCDLLEICKIETESGGQDIAGCYIDCENANDKASGLKIDSELFKCNEVLDCDEFKSCIQAANADGDVG